MRFSIFVRTMGLFSVGLLAALSTPAQDPASSDPVADAARKARAQQQTAPKPKKVFTNDDFTSTPPPKTDAKPGAVQGEDASKTDADQNPENDPKSEVYWRKKFSKVRDKLSMAEKEVEVLQRELDKNQVQYYSDPQKALMQQHDRKDINDNRTKLEAKQKEVEALKKQLSDLEDDLRKAGGDPGWAR